MLATCPTQAGQQLAATEAQKLGNGIRSPTVHPIVEMIVPATSRVGSWRPNHKGCSIIAELGFLQPTDRGDGDSRLANAASPDDADKPSVHQADA